MAGSVNKAVLIGRCGKDPTVRYTQDQRPIVSFSLATDKTWKDRGSGERKQEVTWHNIVIFNTHLAEAAEKFVKKGSHLYVEGEIKNRSWEKDGQKHYITEIIIPAFGGALHLLDRREGSGVPPREDEHTETQRPADRTDPKGNPQWSGGSTGGDLDDEIPFAPEWR